MRREAEILVHDMLQIVRVQERIENPHGHRAWQDNSIISSCTVGNITKIIGIVVVVVIPNEPLFL